MVVLLNFLTRPIIWKSSRGDMQLRIPAKAHTLSKCLTVQSTPSFTRGEMMCTWELFHPRQELTFSFLKAVFLCSEPA